MGRCPHKWLPSTDDPRGAVEVPGHTATFNVYEACAPGGSTLVVGSRCFVISRPQSISGAVLLQEPS
eukprot:353372-Pyramimonas_sp.AAC.1